MYRDKMEKSLRLKFVGSETKRKEVLFLSAVPREKRTRQLGFMT